MTACKQSRQCTSLLVLLSVCRCTRQENLRTQTAVLPMPDGAPQHHRREKFVQVHSILPHHDVHIQAPTQQNLHDELTAKVPASLQFRVQPLPGQEAFMILCMCCGTCHVVSKIKTLRGVSLGERSTTIVCCKPCRYWPIDCNRSYLLDQILSATFYSNRRASKFCTAKHVNRAILSVAENLDLSGNSVSYGTVLSVQETLAAFRESHTRRDRTDELVNLSTTCCHNSTLTTTRAI